MARCVLVTGASSGIGQATAEAFHAAGWNVVATMRRPEEAAHAGRDRWTTAFLDVTDRGSIAAAFDLAEDLHGGVDVLVNNAGYSAVGPFEALDDSSVRRQFETNVFGLMATCREAIPRMRVAGGGQILNVASVGGRVAFPLYSAYHATKWAVEGFSESLQHELRQFGIRVRIIEPGPIRTDFYGRSMETPAVPDAYTAYVARTLPTMQAAGANGASPQVVARTILRASTSRSPRLRWPADRRARYALLLRRLLPDTVFNALVRRAVERT